MRVRVNCAEAGIMLRYIISSRAGTHLSATKLPFLGASNCRSGGNQIYTGCYSAQDIEAFGDATK